MHLAHLRRVLVLVLALGLLGLLGTLGAPPGSAEPLPRGLYGGAVGYIDLRGNLDFCITIRTLLLKGGRAVVQAGAGIVADSDPGSEQRETEAKAAALVEALGLAAEL